MSGEKGSSALESGVEGGATEELLVVKPLPSNHKLTFLLIINCNSLSFVFLQLVENISDCFVPHTKLFPNDSHLH